MCVCESMCVGVYLGMISSLTLISLNDKDVFLSTHSGPKTEFRKILTENTTVLEQ